VFLHGYISDQVFPKNVVHGKVSVRRMKYTECMDYHELEDARAKKNVAEIELKEREGYLETAHETKKPK